MFSEIKRALNKRSLRKQPKPTPRTPTDLARSKWIGIVFDASHLDNLKAVTAYADHLLSEGKQVRLLGYLKDRKEGISLPSFPHFTKAQVNWLDVPTGNVVGNFWTQTFDLLLVLNTKTDLVFEYIATLADARLKFGPVTNALASYDIMVDANASTGIQAFIEQMDALLPKVKATSKSKNKSHALVAA